jgi:acyl-CoA synthetase (AMP-forming)/AMP-acid ligase II
METFNGSWVVGNSGLHHSCHTGLVTREFARVIARHLRVIPAAGVHDAGEIVDRKKDMILSGGQNIYPADIESVMREHSVIAQVAVIGIASECCGMA